MNAKLTKVVAMASCSILISWYWCQCSTAKDYHFKIGENHRMVKNDDGTVDSSAHPWFKPDQKKHRKQNF